MYIMYTKQIQNMNIPIIMVVTLSKQQRKGLRSKAIVLKPVSKYMYSELCKLQYHLVLITANTKTKQKSL